MYLLIRELKLPNSCVNNEDDVEVKGFKFDCLAEELREKRYYKFKLYLFLNHIHNILQLALWETTFF